MDFKADTRFLLLLGAGVVAASWALFNAGAVAQLVQTGTNGYVSMVRGLESPQGGATGGAGAIPTNTALLSGQPYSVPNYSMG